jgi:hypothetical protein
VGTSKNKARVDPDAVDWDRAANAAVGPNPVCSGCGRKPIDAHDRADWVVVFAGFAHGEKARYAVSRVCSGSCFVTALRTVADAEERRTAALIGRALAEQKKNDNASAPKEPRALAQDPVWQAFQRAPFDDEAETEEERRLTEEALKTGSRPLDEIIAELADRCRPGE